MRVNEGLSVLFWLWRAKGSNDGMVPIYVRITVNGGRDGFSSGKKIHPDHWNEETGLAVKACPEQKSINAYIAQTVKEIEKHYDRLKEVNKHVTAAMVKEAYLPKDIVQKSLMQAFDLHNKEFEELVAIGNKSEGTLTRYKRSKKKVEAYLLKKTKKKDIMLQDIQFEMAPSFYHYLLINDISENVAKQYVKTLKQVIKKAVNIGWLLKNPLSGFKCGYVDPDRECLEMHEIMEMYNKEFKINRLSEVRDVYVFCCFPVTPMKQRSTWLLKMYLKGLTESYGSAATGKRPEQRKRFLCYPLHWQSSKNTKIIPIALTIKSYYL